MNLYGQRVFCAPLCTQPPMLCFLTGRAGPLRTSLGRECSIEQMPSQAMRLGCIHRSRTVRVFKRILAGCNDGQVVRIDASSISASVPNKSVPDNPVFGEVADTMSAPVYSTEVECSVAIPIKWTLPNMAFSEKFPLRVKAVSFERRHCHAADGITVRKVKR